MGTPQLPTVGRHYQTTVGIQWESEGGRHMEVAFDQECTKLYNIPMAEREEDYDF